MDPENKTPPSHKGASVNGRDFDNVRGKPDGIRLKGAKLGGADLQGADLIGAYLEDADLRGANLSRANLIGANLRYADLSDANLEDANLTEASLLGADLSGAKLEGTKLAGADLTNANIDYTLLDILDLMNYKNKNQIQQANLETRFVAFEAKIWGFSSKDIIFIDKQAISDGLLNRQEPVELFLGEQRVYVSGESLENAEKLASLADAFLGDLGVEPKTEREWKRGSWIGKTWTWLKDTLSDSEVLDRATVAEDILYGKVDAQTSVEISTATLNLIQGLRDYEGSVALDLGLFIFLKIRKEDGDQILTKRLNVAERALLDSDPSLIGSPERLFERIKEMKEVAPSIAPKDVAKRHADLKQVASAHRNFGS